MDVEFNWNKPVKQVAEEKAGGKEGLLFLANEAKRLMDPYVPADNLLLAQNVRTYVAGEQGIVHYLSPYAHYQYEGEVYGPNYPIMDGGEVMGFYSPPKKKPAGKKLKYKKSPHPLATSEWNKAMKTARGDDLAKAYEDYLRSGKK